MGKRSQRRPSRHERDHAGCISGLISIFDFRHGRTTRRLLADRRRVNKQAVGAGYLSNQTSTPGPTEKCESIADAEESKMLMADFAKTSVKALMEEEMSNEQGSENQPNDEKGLGKSTSNYGNHIKKHQKKRNRSRIKSSDADVSELDAAECLIPENFNQVLEQHPQDDMEKLIEELAQICHRNADGSVHDLHGDLDTPSYQAVTIVEEKLVAAVKLFLEQKLNGSKRFGEERNFSYLKELMDALQTSSLNRGLFLKLLQDPNSKLVKHVQDLEDARLSRDQAPSSSPASSLSGEKPVNSKFDESSNRKQRNFFRRRSKSMDNYPFLGEKELQSANKIVILKPGPAGAPSPEIDIMNSSVRFQSPGRDNKVPSERNASQFSFTEIKRKLRHAMGKERLGVSPDRPALKYSHQNGNNGEKGSTGENVGWSSPNRNHFYTERFTISSPSFKKGELGKLKDNGSAVANETCQYPRLGGSNIYIEAKKHLSEMLKNGDENPDSVTGQLPKSLGRILSLPEYNGTPCGSPRKYGDDIFMTAQMRLSPRNIVKHDLSGLSQEDHNDHLSSRRQNLESKLDISEEKEQSVETNDNIQLRDDQEYSLEIHSITEDTVVPEVAENEETTKSRLEEDEKIISSSSESSSNLNGGDTEKGDTEEVGNIEIASHFLEESSSCFEPPLFGEDQVLSSPVVSPSHCTVMGEIEDSDHAIDKLERPSPISVLEPLFADDDISPPSTISQPVKKEIQPRCIHFEEQPSASDQGLCSRISLEDEESPFEYVEAVLLGSGLNWDEFLLRWLSMYEILDSSLFDEVELFSSRPHHDQKLLFDCANEALKEVCESYFGCFTDVKLNIQPPPKGMDFIHEIWQRVEWHLLQRQQLHSLDHLVKTDLARSRKWMNLQSDIELIVFEMGETILIELVDDIVLVDDTSECDFSSLQADSYVTEDTEL